MAALFIIIIINVVHEVQNKYKHKRKAKRKAKKIEKQKTWQLQRHSTHKYSMAAQKFKTSSCLPNLNFLSQFVSEIAGDSKSGIQITY